MGTTNTHLPSLLSDRVGNGTRFGLSDFLNLFFGTSRLQAQTRAGVLFTGFLIIWLLFASIWHPLNAYASSFEKMLAFLNALFAPDTLLTMLVLLGAPYMAYIWAAGYITDIFEFPDEKTNIARRYISQAAFGVGGNDVVQIRGDNVHQAYRDHPLIKIGGPGRVVVHLECAALFERVDGTPRVLGPNNAKQQINGFERLRAVIDLRDHTESFEVEARTRDGILLRAKDVRVLFSVVRAATQPTPHRDWPALPRNWSFDPTAVQALVYGQKKRPWHRAMVDGKAKPALRNFISQHTFQELISNILPTADAGKMSFAFRQELYQAFEDEFCEGLRRSGIELQWIGVGTWELNINDLQEKHLVLWQKALKAQKQVREAALRKLYNNTRLDTLLHLLQHTLMAVGTTRPVGNVSAEELLIVRSVLQELCNRIRQALLWYKREGKEPPPSLPVVYRHLKGLLSNSLDGSV